MPIIRVPSCLLTPAKVRVLVPKVRRLVPTRVLTTQNSVIKIPEHHAQHTQPRIPTNPPSLLLQLHQKNSTPHSSLSIPPCISLFPSPYPPSLHSTSLPLPHLLILPSHPFYPYTFPLTILSLPSLPLYPSYLSSLSKSLPPPNTNFLTYTHPVPPSLPRSIEIGKTLQRQARPERTGTVDIMAWHLLVTGSARPGWAGLNVSQW